MIKILRSFLFFCLTFSAAACYAQAPNISYVNPPPFIVESGISSLSPSNSGGAVSVGGYSISPVLPTGLSLDANTGTISGTPMLSYPACAYTVTALNSSGSSSAVLNITVTPPSKPAISYGSNPLVFTSSTAITPISLTSSGGVVPNQTIKKFPSGITFAINLCTDDAGNVFVIDDKINGSYAKTLKKIAIGTTTPVAVADLSQDFSYPGLIAIDHAGNIYIGDTDLGTVKKIPAAGGKPILINSGYSSLNGISVDIDGNIYTSDDFNKIKKISADGTQVTTLAISSTFIPTSVTVDHLGNIFFIDRADNSLKKVLANSTTVITLAGGFPSLVGIALDALGDIYMTDPYDKKVVKVLPGGGESAYLNLNGFLYSPSGLAVDKTGNIYIADRGDGAKLINTGGYSITPALPAGLNFDIVTGMIDGTPRKAVPATNYTITAVNDGGYSSTTINIAVKQYPLPVIQYQSPQVYATNKIISPLLTPHSSNVAKAGAYHKEPIAPEINDIGSIAIDAAGNIYVAESILDEVKKIPADGSEPIILASDIEDIYGIAADNTGNVFIIDADHSSLKKIPANGGPAVTIASGLKSPFGLALDPAGRFAYVTSGIGLQKIPVTGGPPVMVGPVFNSVRGVAIDKAGNIYFVNANKIYKISSGSNLAVSVDGVVGFPEMVAVDGAGNLYYTDINATFVREIPAAGGPVIEIGSDLSTPEGITIDAKNALYVVDYSGISKLTPSGGFYINSFLPPGLTFNTKTGVISGTPTAASPATDYSVTAYNQGGATSAVVNIKINFNTGLSNLTLSAGTLSPVFVFATTDYTATVAPTTTSLKLTPTAYEPGAKITINGTVVASGNPSASIPLNTGANSITVNVAAPGGTTTTTYTVTVTRLSSNAALSVITLTPKTTLTLTGTANGVTNYTTSVPFTESSLTVTPTAQDANATIKVNGTAAASGTASQAIPLNVGSNVITLVCTAQDGVTTKTFTITVTRAVSPIATLANLSLSTGMLSPAFAPATTGYTAIVPNATSSIKITPTVTDSNAIVNVNGITVTSGSASAAIALNAGTNTITTVVTAQDGTTTKTYTVSVTRAATGLSTNAVLTSIKINPSTGLTTTSGPGYANYTTSIPNSETSLTVTPTHQDDNSTIKVNGLTVASGTASPAIPLNVGSNVITVVVTAQDGATTKSYIITATRAASPVATLSNLGLSTGTLSPAFAATTTGYTAIVPYATSSIKVTPTVTDANATIKVNGVTVTSGAASASLPLAAGANAITTVVTAQDGTTTKTYTVTVTRAAAGLSTNALLTSIKVTPATTLTKVTGPGYVNYTTQVPNSETSLAVTATHQDANSTIKVNGQTVASGVASSAIPLNVGSNVINVVVTAQDGATTKTYIITATRAGSSVATLSTLGISAGTLSPVFATATTGYTATVTNATASIKVTPTVTDANATIKVNGVTVASGAASASLPLTVGSNAITTVVTAQDGTTTKTYTLTVTRAAAGLSTNALLSSIKITPATGLTTVSGPGYANYTTAVPNSETSLTVTATHQDATATIKVNGTTVASGVASPAIPLNAGSNVINVVVTAQDGATTKTYIITATRAASGMFAQYEVAPVINSKADGITVHQGLSPNGDGDNDVLTIDGITNYPDNTLQVMNRSGELVYQVKGYDNRSKIFDGTSNINGRLQPAGTYFYSLDYKDGNETKHKTGFIVLKY